MKVNSLSAAMDHLSVQQIFQARVRCHAPSPVVRHRLNNYGPTQAPSTNIQRTAQCCTLKQDSDMSPCINYGLRGLDSSDSFLTKSNQTSSLSETSDHPAFPLQPELDGKAVMSSQNSGSQPLYVVTHVDSNSLWRR